MGKGTEERALKAGLERYPEEIIGTEKTLIDSQAPIDANLGKRIIFMEGYKQAEKDTIGRVIMWLEEHADEYNGSESAFDHMEEEMITDLRKAMEEE